ncbi:ABC transporter ATP-binding protein [Herbaspirillum rubrisubalbicans]|uniref:ABC transporter ATP-binding protein n=1 Tax=Herbaspirillum rubrisubalbicans TaxID=80842 RepID=UPI001559B0B2|nr:ABC transporter ATP-binding protein [Herbaspirillum rubrisubalbicans]NQE51549.1 sugar ABC transporter ATP-binding protein [Herbaspirillum rubrisubalbicans]
MGTISIKGLGKAYRQYANRWSRLVEWIVPNGRPRHHLKWILQDLNLEIAAGESVAIVGNNGAGKSTLLKLITQTSQATTGSVEMQGRVAALLELGMGFHPDFTGRQNAVMAAQLLGVSTSEILELMPSIEDFAEIGEYIDQPIRQYSSGMQVRLAFAVATAIRPDILIVDEALSVGDAYFQHKSFERIRQFRREGTTLLLVSHDRMAVQSICDRAVLLDGGRIACEGKPEEVMDFYNALIAQRENSNLTTVTGADGRTQTISGNGDATVEHIELLNADGQPAQMIGVGDMVTLKVQVRINKPIPRLIFGYMLKDRVGQTIYGSNTYYTDQVMEDLKEGSLLQYQLSFAANLGPGSYSVVTALTSSETHLAENYEWRDLALLFNVSNYRHQTFIGSTWLRPSIEVTR